MIHNGDEMVFILSKSSIKIIFKFRSIIKSKFLSFLKYVMSLHTSN